VLPIRRAFTAVVLIAAAAAARPALAETLACTVLASLPTKVTAPGHYCLDRDFVADFASQPIILAASNVVLDCNHHRIEHTGAGYVGAVLAANRSGNVVRNCALSGFKNAIELRETVAGGSRDNRVIGNRVSRAIFQAIAVAGSGNAVEGNVVTELVAHEGMNTTYGIVVSSYDGNGSGNLIRDNVVAGSSAGVHQTGILATGHNTVLSGNFVGGLINGPDLMRATGINGAAGLGNAASGNVILGSAPTINEQYRTFGLKFGAPATATGFNICTHNVVGDWSEPILPYGTAFGGGCVTSQNTTY
jgi:hypothetical protein